MHGTVKWFIDMPGRRTLFQGQRVSFTITNTQKGPAAENVKVVG